MNDETPVRTGVRGVSHLSIQVRDVERSLRFYRDLLGMNVSIDNVVQGQGQRDGKPIDVHRRVVYLRWEEREGATFVLLSQHLNHETAGVPTKLGEMGVDHIAFLVDDVEALLARAREMGEEIAYGPANHPGRSYGHPGGGQIVTGMLRDPDGTMVQVDEWY